MSAFLLGGLTIVLLTTQSCLFTVLFNYLEKRFNKIEAKLDALATANTGKEEKKTATAETPPSSP